MSAPLPCWQQHQADDGQCGHDLQDDDQIEQHVHYYSIPSNLTTLQILKTCGIQRRG
jgi:hypothetical protein